MKLNIFHILIVASISGVISDDSGIIINGKNNTDIPTASTIASNVTTPITPTTIPPSNSTTTVSPTTSSTKSTSTTSSTTQSTPTTTLTPPTVTTPASNATSPTAAPSSTTTAPAPVPPSHRGRKFDGPSFIGGIILASGLMAICFVSWKFYKARTERNYHTL